MPIAVLPPKNTHAASWEGHYPDSAAANVTALRRYLHFYVALAFHSRAVQIKQTLLGCYQEGVLSSLPIKVAPDSAESLELESQATMGLLIPLLALAAVCTGKYHSFFNSLQTQKGFHLGEMGLKPIQY